MSDQHQDVLERRLRTACRQVIPLLADADQADGPDIDLDVMTGAVLDDDRSNVVRLETVHPRQRRSGASALVGAAAAALLVVGGFALLQRNDPASSSAGSGGVAGASRAFDFETQTVSMSADSIQVISGGRTFTPTAAQVNSDPGDPTYTTLEISWTEDGLEQGLSMYFASDSTKWWASEIRTYDSTRAEPKWFEPIATGTFFTTPLGSAFTGDVNLPNLHISGMSLQAFLPPASCDAPTTPLALVTDYPSIVWSTGYYGVTMQVVDTATCKALPAADYAFEYTVDDPKVAIIAQSDSNDATATTVAGSVETKTHFLLQLLTTGKTSVRATARDAGGNIVGTATMSVIVTGEPSNGVPSTTAVATAKP